MWRRRRALENLDDDLRDHIEREIEEQVGQGLPREVARRRALSAFGNVDVAREDARAVWASEWFQFRWLAQLLRDLGWSVRSCRANPHTSLCAVAVLALGVGANTAALAVAYGVLLRPLPVVEPDRLVRIRAPFRLADISAVQSRLSVFTATAAYTTQETTIRGIRGPERVRIALVIGPLLQVLGAVPERGRWPEPELLTEAVTSVRYAQLSESAEPDVLGKVVYVGTSAYTIVGAMASEFEFPDDGVLLWMPAKSFGPAALFGRGDTRTYSVVGRLKPDIGVEAARAEVLHALGDLNLRGVTAAATTVELLSASMSEEEAGILMVFVLAAVLLLLAACANVATLLSGRWLGRRRELVTRLTMGGTPGSLVRLALSESLLLAIVGSLVGVLLAHWVVAAFVALAGDTLPRQNAIAIDGPILLAAAGFILVVALASGAVPALSVVSASNVVVTREREPLRSRYLDNLLLLVQVATSVFLLIGAGLLAQTVTGLLGRGAGNASHNALVVRLPAADDATAASERPGYAEEVLREVRAIPGVVAAGIGNGLPPSQSLSMSVRMVDPGRRDDSHPVNLVAATPGYFEAVGIALDQGRWFTDADQDGEPVAVISQRVARDILRSPDPLGRQLPFPLPTRSGKLVRPRVLGIVGDVRYSGLDSDALGNVYVRWQDLSVGVPFLVLRVAKDPVAMIPSVRRAVQGIDSTAAVPDVRPLETVLKSAIASRHLRMWLVGLFAVLTLAIVLVGMVAVVTRAVDERRKELAIRSVLGASPGSGITFILGKYAPTVLLGLLVGLVATAWSSKWLAHFLYGVSPHHLGTYGAAGLVVLVTAGVTGYLSARHAARIAAGHELRNG